MIKRAKLIQTFEQRLFDLLPLYNVSHERGFDNKVIEYCYFELGKMGRTVDYDKHCNVWSVGNDPSSANRVVVAHTDSVGKHDQHKRQQKIRYNKFTDIIYNESQFRPMGADDKVGVAVALTIAQYFPEFSVLLTSDEEVGLIGASAYDGPEFMFGVQCDRRGSIDLVNSVFGTIASEKTSKAAKSLLPHRNLVGGMATDVGALVSSGKIKCAFNMSCGYYRPHFEEEYIVLSEAIMAFNDALTLMLGLIDDDLEDVSNKAYARYRRSGSGVGYYDDAYDEDINSYLTSPTVQPSRFLNSATGSVTAPTLTSMNRELSSKNDNLVVGNDNEGNFLAVEFIDGNPVLSIYKPGKPAEFTTVISNPAKEPEQEAVTQSAKKLFSIETRFHKKQAPISCDFCGNQIVNGEAYKELQSVGNACETCFATVDPDELISYVTGHEDRVTDDIAALTPEALKTLNAGVSSV